MQISMRSSLVSLGYFRVQDTDVLSRPSGEVSLLDFWISCLGFVCLAVGWPSFQRQLVVQGCCLCSGGRVGGAYMCVLFMCEVGFLRSGVDHVGGSTGRRVIIVGLTGFSVWLEYGGHIFCGDGGITIFVRVQGGVLGTDPHEVFVGEYGVLQCARY